MDVQNGTGNPNDTDPPPNIHGDKVFMIKLQTPANTGGTFQKTSSYMIGKRASRYT